MKITGEIVKETKTYVLVRSHRPASCEGCASAGVCQKKTVELPAINEIGAKTGDLVLVDVREDVRAIGMFAYIFLVPVAILLLAAWLYTLLPWLALIALPLTLAYILVLKQFNANWQIRATVVAFAHETEETPCTECPK